MEPTLDHSPAPSNRDLRGRNLVGQDFQDQDLRSADLVACNLEAANLIGCQLNGAQMHKVRLRRATLVNAVLSNISGRDADLENADLQNADMRGSDLRHAIFLEADLSGADLRGANLSGADLRDANLTNANLDNAILDGADLAGARLDGIHFSGLTAKSARIKNVDSIDLATALRTAGAESRPPLRIGRLVNLIFLAAGTSAHLLVGMLRRILALANPIVAAIGPAVAPISPALRQLMRMNIRIGRAIVQLPGVLTRQLRNRSVWMGGQMTRGAHRSREIATTMRLEVQSRLRQAALNREVRGRLRAERIEKQRIERAARAQVSLPGGPGANLQGQDFRRQKLNFAVWHEANLQGANMDGAYLDKADLRNAILEDAQLVGARLRDADLRGAHLPNAQLEGARMQGAIISGVNAQGSVWIDADLRNVDFGGSDLTGANLTGADLRNARLNGANLTRANLTGVRMPDVDLLDATLDFATLEQADVAGVRWADTSVRGADLTGVIGMAARQREALRQQGAIVDDIHLERILGRLGTRPVQMGMGILAVGMATYLAARFAGSDVINPAQLEVQAQNLREQDPMAASERYVELANVARRVDDEVGYLVEAASLADVAGNIDAAENHLRDALEAAENEPLLQAETRLALAQFLHQHQKWTDSLSEVEPLVTLIDQPTEQRARAFVLYDKNRDALGMTDAGPREAVFSAMGDLPETQAALHLALAELYTNEGETARALVEVNTANNLDVPEDIRIRLLEAHARINDRSGNHDEAIRTWKQVLRQAEKTSIAAQAAQLAVADLQLRQGRTNQADVGLQALLATRTDDRVRGRALLVAARIAEKRDQPEKAVAAYRQVLDIADLDTETGDEARIAMASLVLANPDNQDASLVLAKLAPAAMQEVMAHARLGEARSLLDEGKATEAHQTYLRLLEVDGVPASVRRATRAGLGEALAQMGELRDALDIWRELLAEPASSHDRIQLELLIANGLLQGGKRNEASTAFRSLADSENAEARIQGLLGLAEVARAGSERSRARSLYRQVADQEVDPIWNVRALQELADMAAEDGDGALVVTLTRELIGALPPSHPIAPNARLSLVSALLQVDDINEAGTVCQAALESAPNQMARTSAQVSCAEVWERSSAWTKAIDAYQAVLDQPAEPDVHTDAALGVARSALASDAPAKALAATEIALAKADPPALRLPLLSMQIRALRRLDQPVRYRAAIAERDTIAEQVPDVAWSSFVDDAGQSRTNGEPQIAVDLLEQALRLPITNKQRAAVLVQLGASLLDLSQIAEAEKRFSQAKTLSENDSPQSFYAGMGLAEVMRRKGDPEQAIEILNTLSPPDKDENDAWMIAKANALTDAGDPQAQAAWVALAGAPDTNLETQYTALKGQADALLAQDRHAEAITAFEQARALATEDWQEGWAALGLAAALAGAEQGEAAMTLLDDLRRHVDPEVRMEASLRRSQYASDNEEWSIALRVLEPKEAIKLGPGWDASSTQARTRALYGAGDSTGAEAAWRALARRWPDEEEALLPSWLGLAQLALENGDSAEAHRWARKAYKEARDPGYRSQAQDLVRSMAE